MGYILWFISWLWFKLFFPFSVKQDVETSDDEGMRIKEQSILELGQLLAKTGQADGKLSIIPVFLNLLFFNISLWSLQPHTI